jgi:hypothetical protein
MVLGFTSSVSYRAIFMTVTREGPALFEAGLSWQSTPAEVNPLRLFSVGVFEEYGISEQSTSNSGKENGHPVRD